MTLRAVDAQDVEMVILPPVRDIGGFNVRRALPSMHRRMVGPFIFFDQMGPAVFDAGTGLDVRPHPHIGLATVTYLLNGEMLHRDSIGSVQAIKPGEVNWMTAGSGIAHSERTGPETRATGGPLFGLQTWVALPRAAEETAPSFAHHGADTIPRLEADGVAMSLVIGALDGLSSPVRPFSDTVFADIALAQNARYQLRKGHTERAIYVVSGAIEIAGQTGAFNTGELVVFKPDAEIILRAQDAARLMLIGGEALPEKRYIFWNFVSSSQERIEQAKQDWRAQRFAPVPEEHEFIPLPEDPPAVRYP